MGGKELIVIVGPTGSGKSSLSMALAAHYGSPILSTDSRQFYRGIPIGTAQPPQSDLAAAEHHFIACRDLEEDYNAGQYEKDALVRLEELFKEHNRVITVGGSGLYIKALCEGFDDLPDVPKEVRDSVRRLYAERGREALLEELKERDAEFYEQIDKCNHSRVMRALEVCRSSVDGKYSTLRQSSVSQRDFKIVKVGLDLPREELYNRINLRVEQMVAEGLESEAKAVYHLRELNSLQTVGYREMFDYFDGTISLDEAIELIQRNSRRYAKRQMTWFRRDCEIEWFTEFAPDRVIAHSDGLRK